MSTTFNKVQAIFVSLRAKGNAAYQSIQLKTFLILKQNAEKFRNNTKEL